MKKIIPFGMGGRAMISKHKVGMEAGLGRTSVQNDFTRTSFHGE